jgi:hypothetical protein
MTQQLDRPERFTRPDTTPPSWRQSFAVTVLQVWVLARPLVVPAVASGLVIGGTYTFHRGAALVVAGLLLFLLEYHARGQ